MTSLFRDFSKKLPTTMPTLLLELTLKNLVYLLPFFASQILFITPEQVAEVAADDLDIEY
jgi:hypothetical protein